MKHYLVVPLIFFCSLCSAQKITANNNCIKHPSFPQRFGYNINTSALSTSEPRKKGLFLVGNTAESGIARKLFQDPSWSKAGALGSMIFDELGNVYTFPVPHVNLIDNPPDKNNIIYKIDAVSGEMKEWKSLPLAKNLSDQNVYGIMGMTFSCLTRSIYVSSISGSTRAEEIGKIYQIDIKSGEILDYLDNFDGFGLLSANVNNLNSLLAGSVRTSNLYSIDLKENGNFASRPKVLTSIADQGPRGDDKIKKIIVNQQQGSLQITGFEFQFNLASTLQLEESLYSIKLKN